MAFMHCKCAYSHVQMGSTNWIQYIKYNDDANHIDEVRREICWGDLPPPGETGRGLEGGYDKDTLYASINVSNNKKYNENFNIWLAESVDPHRLYSLYSMSSVVGCEGSKERTQSIPFCSCARNSDVRKRKVNKIHCKQQESRISGVSLLWVATTTTLLPIKLHKVQRNDPAQRVKTEY